MREGDRWKDYRLCQERRRLENGEKDLVIYKGEITTKQALQQETGTEVLDIQPQTRNQGQGNSKSRPSKGKGRRSNLILLLTLYIVYTQILTNLTPLKLRKLTLKHTLTLFLLTSPPNHLTVQLPQTLGEIPLGRRGWVRKGDRGKGNTTVKDTLTCALINARSLCNKKEEMVSYVYENTPDMVFVTESWVNENTMDSELALNGYVTRRKDRRGGGGLIYATEEVSAQCDIELSDCNEEILWCRLAEGKILAGVCYNSTSNMQEVEAKIYSNIIQACSRTSNKEVMLCGDFNHNTIN